jgi:1-acyl-sn-glycerol-3-phosphate acyltransferase
MGAIVSKIIKPALVLAVIGTFAMLPLLIIGVILLISWPLLPTKMYANLAATLQNQFLIAFVWLYERNHSGLTVHVSGDDLPAGESALIVSNHVASHGDWAPMYSLVARQSSTSLGGFKCVIKDVAKWIPGFGWCMWLLNWPFLKRN